MGSIVGGIIGGVGSLIAGNKANKNVAKGIDAQTEAARLALEAQRQGFVDTTRLQQGRAQSGDAATARMLQILGLPVPEALTSGAAYQSIFGGGGNGLAGGGGAGGQFSSYVDANPDLATEYARVAGGGFGPNLPSSYDANGDGRVGKDEFGQFHYDRFGSQEGRALPGGEGAGGPGGPGAGGYGIDVPDIGGANGLTAMIKGTPGYQFRMDEGVKAIDSSAASRGMLLSGSQLKRLQDFGSEYAAQEFDKYWNRLAGVSGAGQTATGDISGAAQQNAANQGSIQTQLGQGLNTSYGQQTSGFGNALGVVGGAVQQAYKPQPINFNFGGG